MRTYLLLGLAIGCGQADPIPSPDGGGVVRIDVNEDGTFDPAHVEIHSGDTIEWVLHDRRASIIEASGSTQACPAPVEWQPTSFTGPMPQAPSGIYALSA